VIHSPPGASPVNPTSAAGVADRTYGPRQLSSRVRITNNSQNTDGIIRRRDAMFFFKKGRARYLGCDSSGQDQIAVWPTGKFVTKQELRNIGVVSRQGVRKNVGKGALGRKTLDHTICFPLNQPTNHSSNTAQ
jgi:hypothetical protein